MGGEPSIAAMKSVIKWGDAVCGDDAFAKTVLAKAFDDHSETLLTAVREMWDALKPFAQETAFSRAAGSLKQTTRLPLEDYERASATLTKYAGIGE